jgi:hypothetical protein
LDRMGRYWEGGFLGRVGIWYVGLLLHRQRYLMHLDCQSSPVCVTAEAVLSLLQILISVGTQENRGFQ